MVQTFSVSTAFTLTPPKPTAEALYAAALRHCQTGQLQDGERACRRLLAEHPDHPEGLHLLGLIAHQFGHQAPARELISKAIVLRPDNDIYRANLGNVLKAEGRLDDAIAQYYAALQIRPQAPVTLSNLGAALEDQGRLDEAAGCLHEALALNPDATAALNNLGNVLRKQGKQQEALSCYRRALDSNPGLLAAHNNLGNALRDLGQFEEAIASYRTAVGANESAPLAWNNLGAALREAGQLQEAQSCHRRAIALNPNYAEAHLNLAIALLAAGEMDEGWREFEWRWQTPQMATGQRNFTQPQWQGEPAEGRTLLIHAEQGFGDTVQFCRFAPVAAALGWQVVLEVQPTLVRLLQPLPGVAQVVGRGEALPDFDLHCPMLSLPVAIGRPPDPAPYLTAAATEAKAWRARIGRKGRRRVGLAWAGNPRRHTPNGMVVDQRRSLPLDRLAPLLAVPNIRWFSLQKDGPAAPDEFGVTDFMPEVEDFADTAALIAGLDLVISVDTAVAHLAGAMGKPVWLLNRFDPCWRWMTGRRDSPWYPTLRIYRQAQPNGWDAVLAEVAQDLEAFAARRG